MRSEGRRSGLFVALVVGAVMIVGVGGEAMAGLVAHWTFDDGSGGVATDVTGNGNDGMLVNGPGWTTGLMGGALSFNGSNQYVDCGNDPSLGLTGDLTISAFIQPTAAILAARGTVVGKHYNGEFEMTADPMRSRMQYYHGPVWNNNAGSVSFLFTLGHWYQMAVTRDASTKTLTGYVIDITDATVSTKPWSYGTDPNPTTNKVLIGRRTPGGLYFPGIIDDVRIYDEVLTRDEILAIYPEPGTLALLGVGALALLRRRRRA